jgi:hypothetical protein
MFRKVVRAAELLPPRRISNDDFAAICKTSDIAWEMRAAARDFLDDAVNGFAEAITNAEALPARRPDRLAIERAIADLRSAQHRLKRRAGPAGAMGLQVAGRHIAPALSVSWMRRHFRATPSPIYWPPDDRSGRDPFGGREPSRPIEQWRKARKKPLAAVAATPPCHSPNLRSLLVVEAGTLPPFHYGLRVELAKNVDQAGDNPGPSRLMAGADARAIVAMEVFIEQ